MSKKILLNGCYGGFSIDSSVLKEYNERNGTSLSYSDDNDIRCIPEFIERVENGEKIGGYSAALYVDVIPEDALKFGAYEIEEYDGVEDLKINYDKIEKENAKIERKKTEEKFFEMLNQILYESEIGDKEKLEYLKMMIPQVIITDGTNEKKLDDLVENLQYVPGFGEAFIESRNNFYLEVTKTRE